VLASAVVLVAALTLALSARAQAPAQGPKSLIFTCTDAKGKKQTSDRLIAECIGREQRILNSDGSLNRIVPPTLTADERTEMENKEQQQKAEEIQRMDAIRRDRNLVHRFPNEEAHNKARAQALDDIRASVRISESRIALLNVERKPLLDEAEFYKGKPLPNKLKLALDANDAALEAQQSLVQNQQAEIVRINALYDVERVRLRKLWAGAPAGSLGPASAPARSGPN
jgi:hypothetical protein